jgi:hypothetical protein
VTRVIARRTQPGARSMLKGAGKKMQKKVANVTDNVIDKVEKQVENVQGVFRKIGNA